MSKLVRMKGLEPPRLAALEPKSSASTNSATSAKPSIIAFERRSLVVATHIRDASLRVVKPFYGR
jgi:hypothetical protein